MSRLPQLTAQKGLDVQQKFGQRLIAHTPPSVRHHIVIE